MNIDINVVRDLIKMQFPEWSHLEITPVKNSGHDNRTFHLGEQLAIRMPSVKEYEAQVEKEAKWLPKIAAQLSYPITCPVAKGKPSKEYPYHWSVNRWIDGETLTKKNLDQNQLAIDLASFLIELQTTNPTNGPVPGKHNFFRGGNLSVYNDETIKALDKLDTAVIREKCIQIWKQALNTSWERKPVWIHGDLAPGNIIIQNNHLSGVIDFGCMGVGDPACDYVIAWTFFSHQSRKIFKEQLHVDEKTWNRAKGWALWKALITYDDPVSQKVVQILTSEIT